MAGTTLHDGERVTHTLTLLDDPLIIPTHDMYRGSSIDSAFRSRSNGPQFLLDPWPPQLSVSDGYHATGAPLVLFHRYKSVSMQERQITSITLPSMRDDMSDVVAQFAATMRLQLSEPSAARRMFFKEINYDE